MSDLLKKLSAPFPPDRISWRVGSTTSDKKRGMALAYIDSRDVQARLDEVCGPLWQATYPHAGQKTVCSIGIKVGDEWVWRSDGAGDTDIESEKGALSDAFKRAAVKWGVGRYLYDMDSPWVELVPAGKSYAIAPAEMKRLRGEKVSAPVPTAAPQTTTPTLPAGIKAKDPEDWAAKFTAGVLESHSVPVLNNLYEANKAWLGKLPQDLQDSCTHAFERRMAYLSQAPKQQAAE